MLCTGRLYSAAAVREWSRRCPKGLGGKTVFFGVQLTKSLKNDFEVLGKVGANCALAGSEMKKMLERKVVLGLSSE